MQPRAHSSTVTVAYGGHPVECASTAVAVLMSYINCNLPSLVLRSSKNWVTSPSVKRFFMASQSLSQVFEHPKKNLRAFMAKTDDGQMKIMPHEGERILQLSMGEESEQHQYALHCATV